jgi:hypothetical protein
MSGLLASLAVIGGFLALVTVLVIAVKLAVFWLDRRDDRRLLAQRRHVTSPREEGRLPGVAGDRLAIRLLRDE